MFRLKPVFLPGAASVRATPKRMWPTPLARPTPGRWSVYDDHHRGIAEVQHGDLSEEHVARIWDAEICKRWQNKGRCRKGRKCKFLHAYGRDAKTGNLGRLYPTQVTEGRERSSWGHTGHVIPQMVDLQRLRGQNLLPWLKRFIDAHKPEVPHILGDIQHLGERTEVYLNAPLHARDILSCEFIDDFVTKTNMLHCTNIPCALSALVTGHLVARKPVGCDYAPVGCYFAPTEQHNANYNLGATFKASLFGCVKNWKNTNIQKNENVAPTGWICTLSHRAAHDHVTDSWSHQLTSVTFKTRLLEAFLQMWCDDGCRTMPLPLRLFERCERPKSHRLTSFSGSEQDPALVERTLRALDERHESLRTRIGISQRH